MFLTGLVDEAAPGIDGQIKAALELGWKSVELRGLNGVNVHDVPDADFDRMRGKLEKAGLKACCFSSAIANWGKKITDPFDVSVEEAARAISRMKLLGAGMIRIMSYAVLPGRGPEDQMAGERFRRLRELQRMFAGEGIVCAHENCMNYGGMGWPFTERLLEAVPGMKLVYDTGNPVFSDDRTDDPPCRKQSSWEFYSHVKRHVAHVHIKDGRWDANAKRMLYTHAGEGDGDVRRILGDLIRGGYDGGICIEPHMAVVVHEGATAKKKAGAMYRGFIEYGRRVTRLISEVDAAIGQGRF